MASAPGWFEGTSLNTAVLVPAAGRGERLGPGAPKALRELGDIPMLVHAVRSLLAARGVTAVVVAAPPDGVAGVRDLLRAQLPAESPVRVVAGGATRQESVRLALAAVPTDHDIVLVHDAARPFVPAHVVEAVITAVADGADAVVPALPVVDTVKEVAAANGAETVVRTVDRSLLRAVQTPQGFRRAVLARAHAEAEGFGAEGATDDAGMVERTGGTVVVVPGSEEAFKVTRPFDLLLARALLERRAERAGQARADEADGAAESTEIDVVR
ncbi:2-C-methyl-D-erythritol 4-phosphate cytidylyltransferase [Embleya sp. MST-111070]|uniref:2-C-methyl-D-erythritol 4-phosphate cytidylyltransferase n=1 Tax=Embleya sp. MST-111070 TaxID=3398231 RepID=UPI003F73D7B5